MMDQDLESLKKAARQEAFARRKAAHETKSPKDSRFLYITLKGFENHVIAGYMPIRSEIDPLPVLRALSRFNTICLPVIMGEGQALEFSRWQPNGPLRDGPFGAQVPEVDDFITPDVVIVPLVAFDAQGGRLGYGGGFYDRTLEGLRARGDVLAYGFAYAEQEADELPLESTDQSLDGIITQRGVITFDGRV